MDYKPEHSVSAERGTGKKKKLTREDFKKDVADAVKRGIQKPKRKRAPRAKKANKYAAGYDGMSVAQLRKFLNDKKRNLLTKSGFPDGKLPRSKVAMITLCKKLKRKRW